MMQSKNDGSIVLWSQSLMVVKLKYAPHVIIGKAANPNYRIADQMHIVMHADHILEIHDVGVRVFD